MEYSAIFHDMDKRFCYAIEKDLFVIRVQVKKDDMKEEAQTWQKVRNMISSLRRTQSGIVWIIRNSHSRKRLKIWESVILLSKTWLRAAREHEGCVPTRGSGNYSSDEAKEIARLQRELRDTKDALEILKKAISILGK